MKELSGKVNIHLLKVNIHFNDIVIRNIKNKRNFTVCTSRCVFLVSDYKKKLLRMPYKVVILK